MRPPQWRTGGTGRPQRSPESRLALGGWQSLTLHGEDGVRDIKVKGGFWEVARASRPLWRERPAPASGMSPSTAAKRDRSRTQTRHKRARPGCPRYLTALPRRPLPGFLCYPAAFDSAASSAAWGPPRIQETIVDVSRQSQPYRLRYRVFCAAYKS